MSDSSRSQCEKTSPDFEEKPFPGIRPLAILAVFSTVIYIVIALLSSRFEFDTPTIDRPIIIVLLLFAFCFLAYLCAIRIATKTIQDSRLVWMIVVAAVVFRFSMLFSVPIQEVDIYRYVWDGAVTTQGVSPFRYPPEQVLAAPADDPGDRKLQKLVRMRDQNDAMGEILRRVHFGELPSIYPSTSQAIFYCATITTPQDASVSIRVLIMKTWLIGFDLGTLFLVIQLLRICRLPIGLSLVYAWCPLVIKEVANSGHLDAIAIFFTTLALYLVVKMQFGLKDKAANSASNLGYMVMVAIVLAAGIGAKLYPVVLVPLIFFWLVKRFGFRPVIIPAIIFAAVTFLLIFPLLPMHSANSVDQSSEQNSDLNSPPLPTESDAISKRHSIPKNNNAISVPTNDPSLGVTTFLKSWEMNDFIFMILVENLKRNQDSSTGQGVWFSIVPDEYRQAILCPAMKWLDISEAEAPFLTTRFVTGLVFAVIAFCLALQACRRENIIGLCEAGFLTLAWFWLLLPTQNPWYWLWAMPLLPFVRNRAWLVVSGIVLIYYLRFWFDYHFKDFPVPGSNYEGKAFFDFVIVWLEFAPWFAWLAIEARRRILDKKRRVNNESESTT